MGSENQESAEFWGRLGLLRGAELPFLEGDVDLRTCMLHSEKQSVVFIQTVPFCTQIFLLSLTDTSFEDVLKYYKQLTSHFQAFY